MGKIHERNSTGEKSIMVIKHKKKWINLISNNRREQSPQQERLYVQYVSKRAWWYNALEKMSIKGSTHWRWTMICYYPVKVNIHTLDSEFYPWVHSKHTGTNMSGTDKCLSRKNINANVVSCSHEWLHKAIWMNLRNNLCTKQKQKTTNGVSLL